MDQEAATIINHLSVLTQIGAKKNKEEKKELQQEIYFWREIVKLWRFFKF